nr:acetyl-CoA C-acetyltransferase [uncultured Bacillus sp.]
MGQKEVVLLEGARTPFAEINGSFREIPAIELGTIASREAIRKAQVDPEEIDHVVFGNVQQSSCDAHFLARHIGLKAGVPVHVPAVTVNRLCGTGIEVILSAARLIQNGEAELVLAGGTESMSQVPHVVKGMRWGAPLGSVKLEDWLWEGLYDSYGDCTMSITAENLAKKYELSREKIDQHAFYSHQKALAAMEKGYFKEEIIPVSVQHKKGTRIIEQDEHPRNTSMDQLSRLQARFIKEGVVTPGNASGMNDAGAAVLMASADYAAKKGLKPIARLVAGDVVGVEPKYMGIGPVPAIRRALGKAGLRLQDLHLIEINEAFSAQYLACEKELGFDPEIGNVNGGAVALGHPLAASGVRISLTLIYELGRRGKKYGASSVCIGGGQGIAALWERL